MTYVITEPCVGVVDHACVDVCPMDCIYEVEDQLVIHPAECIDCGACVAECPVAAIFHESDVPLQWQGYIQKNAAAFTHGEPSIATSRNEHQRRRSGVASLSGVQQD